MYIIFYITEYKGIELKMYASNAYCHYWIMAINQPNSFNVPCSISL